MVKLFPTRFLLLVASYLLMLPFGYAQSAKMAPLTGYSTPAAQRVAGEEPMPSSTCSTCYGNPSQPIQGQAARTKGPFASTQSHLSKLTGASAAYVRSTNLPWGTFGDNANTSAMDAVFGAGAWDNLFLESATAAAVFSASRQLVFLEGSDQGANALNAFLQANRTVIENWVAAGGHLLLNAAPNQGGNIDFGFGGTTLNFNGSYPFASLNATVTAGHPIALGPFLPAGSSFTGGYFAHATVSGPGLTTAITGTAGIILGYKNWGDGYVFLGGMTTDNFHRPQPNAHNLRKNILAFTPPCTSPVLTVPSAITVNNDANQCGATVPFTSTATGTPTPGIVYSLGTTTVNSPYVFPVGTTTVTVTATNRCGTAAKTFTVTVNDTQKPTVVTHDVSVALSNGAATVTAAQVNNGSTDNCSIKTLSLDKSSFNCDNIGANTVTLSVTDASGNVSTGTAIVTVTGSIPTPSIAVTPSSSVYTGGVPTTLYLGYGPQSATLTASGGVSYVWSPAAGLDNAASASPVFLATAPGTFTYTVTATSTSGCTATTSVTLTVVDARCGNKNDKVVVCHNGHEICISPNAVNTHLTGHPGDQLGACSVTAARMSEPMAAASGSINELSVYPNPAVGQATVSFRTKLDGNVKVVIYNELGQRVASLYDGAVTGGQLYEFPLKGQNLVTGLYECRLVVNGKAQMQRLIIAR